MTLFQLKEQLSTVGAEIRAASSWIGENAAKPEIPMADIQAKISRRDEMQARYNAIKAEHDTLENDEKEKLKQKEADNANASDPKNGRAQAKGEFYKAVLTGGDVTKVVKAAYTHLGAIPQNDSSLGNGENLLPVNISNELIVEPAQENPMRTVVRMSNITGLEEPRLIFDIDGSAYDDITDKQTAKEIKQSSDTVTYGRHKVKVGAKISDTIIHGSTLSVAAEVDNALRSGLAVNEMRRMFAESPDSAYAHMSFYSSENAIKKIEKSTNLQDAIGAALADLPMSYRRNAKIVMSGIDWYGMWSRNLNSSGTFYEDRPLTLFGKEVVLCDDAVSPIVGDFNYVRLNYDIGTTYDSDKDIKAGTYLFVLTAWYDIQFRLKSAFRIAQCPTPATP